MPQTPIIRLPRSALLNELAGYTACSAAALVLDYGLLLALTSLLGVHYLIASAVGFLSGLVLVYALASRFVFRETSRPDSPIGLGCFLVTGLVGLGLTQLLMGLWVGRLGLAVPVAKALTVGAVFVFNYLSRRTLLRLTHAAAAGPAPCRSQA
jgi:putative flippase GtrA